MRKRSSINKTPLTVDIVEAVAISAKQSPHKNPAAVALGRMGGLKGGRARADLLSKTRRIEIAKVAAKARWNKPKE